MNPWLFSFLVSFVLMLLLINFRQFQMNLYGGIISAVFMQAESLLAENLGLFEYNFVTLNMPGILLFSDRVNIFFTGIAFCMGVLASAFHPRKMIYQLVHALMWSLFLIGFNVLAAQFDLVDYIRFKPYFVVRQFLLFLFFAWIRNNFALSELKSVKRGE